jgi:uncharacterized membrane protein
VEVDSAVVEGEVVIDRPLPEVWAFLTDFRNMPKWARGVDSITAISPGPVGVGTVVKDVGLGLGRRWDEEFVVDEFVPERELGLRWSGSYGVARVRYSLAETADGVRLRGRTSGDYRFPFFLVLLFTRKLARRNFTAGLSNIKHLVEGEQLDRK